MSWLGRKPPVLPCCIANHDPTKQFQAVSENYADAIPIERNGGRTGIELVVKAREKKFTSPRVAYQLGDRQDGSQFSKF